MYPINSAEKSALPNTNLLSLSSFIYPMWQEEKILLALPSYPSPPLDIISSMRLCCTKDSTSTDWSNPQMEGEMPFHPHLWKDADVVGKALVPFETQGEQMSSTFEINYSKTYCIVLSSPSFFPWPPHRRALTETSVMCIFSLSCQGQNGTAETLTEVKESADPG